MATLCCTEISSFVNFSCTFVSAGKCSSLVLNAMLLAEIGTGTRSACSGRSHAGTSAVDAAGNAAPTTSRALTRAVRPPSSTPTRPLGSTIQTSPRTTSIPASRSSSSIAARGSTSITRLPLLAAASASARRPLPITMTSMWPVAGESGRCVTPSRLDHAWRRIRTSPPTRRSSSSRYGDDVKRRRARGVDEHHEPVMRPRHGGRSSALP